MSAAGNYVLLRAGVLRLLLPQSDVGAAEYLDTRPLPAGSPGLLRARDPNDPRRYAVLSDAMTLLADCPVERFVGCTLTRGAEGIVWCWDELRVLIGIDVQPIPLPAPLRADRMPSAAYVELDGGPAFLCSAEDLCRFALPGPEASDAA